MQNGWRKHDAPAGVRPSESVRAATTSASSAFSAGHTAVGAAASAGASIDRHAWASPSGSWRSSAARRSTLRQKR